MSKRGPPELPEHIAKLMYTRRVNRLPVVDALGRRRTCVPPKDLRRGR